MILDSHIERRVSIPSTLGMPRWHKRVIYYIFKIRYLQNNDKYLSRIPNGKVRMHLAASYFNEYELYARKFI